MTESEIENDHFDLDHFDRVNFSVKLLKIVAKICLCEIKLLNLPQIYNQKKRNYEQRDWKKPESAA